VRATPAEKGRIRNPSQKFAHRASPPRRTALLQALTKIVSDAA
jgi:hypothetical protein